MGGSPFDGLSSVVVFQESVDEAGSEGVSAADTVEYFEVLAVDGIVKFSVMPGEGSPIVVRCRMDFAEGGGRGFEVGVGGDRFFDHGFEVTDLDALEAEAEEIPITVEDIGAAFKGKSLTSSAGLNAIGYEMLR